MTQVAMQKTVVARPEKRGKVQRLKFDLYDGLRFWSAFTHGFGAIAGGAGGVVLLVLSILD